MEHRGGDGDGTLRACCNIFNSFQDICDESIGIIAVISVLTLNISTQETIRRSNRVQLFIQDTGEVHFLILSGSFPAWFFSYFIIMFKYFINCY